MKLKQYISIVFFIVGLINCVHSQRYTIRNGIGLQGGLTQFDIFTDNLETRANTGYFGGLAASVDIPHKWYNLSYNITLAENNIDVNARPEGSDETEFAEFKMLTAQVSFLIHVKIIGNYLSFDVGPMLQYNGELDIKDPNKREYVLVGYDTLRVADISTISRFNVNGAVGLTLGLGRFSLRAQYIYGFTNILGKLNDQNLDLSGAENTKFKGNQSMLAFSAVITL
jgi:hypothetical protein